MWHWTHIIYHTTQNYWPYRAVEWSLKDATKVIAPTYDLESWKEPPYLNSNNNKIQIKLKIITFLEPTRAKKHGHQGALNNKER